VVTIAASYRRAAAEHLAGQFRYGIVLGLVGCLVFFQIAAPAARWSLALDVALAGAALTVAVTTARAPGRVRRRRAQVGAVVILLGIALGAVGSSGTFVVLTLLVASIPVTLVGGLVRLVKQKGVTVQVVAGALAMYLLVGLLFASIIAFVAHIESGPYFAQGNESDAVDLYYSFTALTTTGFGDYTPHTPFGHALAVLEMLTGQLYLITVIGIIVGNFVGRRVRKEPE
jgi:hypothetical protein